MAVVIVAKFGGTSVGDAGAVGRLIDIVRERHDVKVIVVSALSRVTDQLIGAGVMATSGDMEMARHVIEGVRDRHRLLAEELLGEAASTFESELDRELGHLEEILTGIATRQQSTPAERDEIVATGELLSSRLVAAALQRQGLHSIWIDARDVLVTDAQHEKAQPLSELTQTRLRQRVAPLINDGRLAVMGGFVGATVDGKTTTLGRGGSDYSASIVGAGLGASEIQIWTDVDGMLAADPRLVSHACLVPHLSFAEASELAHFGAKVLHPSTILPAMTRNIPVRILNARRPHAPSTLITAHAPASDTPLRAIACKRDVTVIDITSTRMLMAHGFLRRVFEVFDRYETVVDVVTTSEVSVSVTIDDARAVEQILAELVGFSEAAAEPGFALVCAVGERLRTDSALCGQIVSALEGLPLRMVSQAASRQNVTFVVAEADLSTAIGRLYQRFFERAANGPESMVASGIGERGAGIGDRRTGSGDRGSAFAEATADKSGGGG